MKLLRKCKAKHMGRSPSGMQVEAWDRLYYMRIAQVNSSVSMRSSGLQCCCMALVLV